MRHAVEAEVAEIDDGLTGPIGGDLISRRTFLRSAETTSRSMISGAVNRSRRSRSRACDIPVLRKLGIPADKITLLGNGVDLDRFGPDPESREAVRTEWGFEADDVVFGVVGRLVAEKGFVELFEVVDRLAGSHPTVRWMVVGPDDPDKPDALDRGLVRRAEAEGVRFLGGRTDVERLYPAMDVFVLPSHREGFSRSGMEAAACGVPIITTDVRGCRQVVRDGRTGLLVPVRDAAALGRAVVELAEDPDRRARMAGAGRELAEAEFDQRRQMQITLETYERLGVRPII